MLSGLSLSSDGGMLSVETNAGRQFRLKEPNHIISPSSYLAQADDFFSTTIAQCGIALSHYGNRTSEGTYAYSVSSTTTGSETVSQYSLSVRGTFYSGVSLMGTKSVSSLSSQAPRDIALSPDGSSFFAVCVNRAIVKWNMPTPWVLSSAPTSADTYYPFSGEPFGTLGTTLSIAFSNDGRKMFVMGTEIQRKYSAYGNLIAEYALSSPYNISGAVFTGVTRALDELGNGEVPRGMTFSKDGLTFFVGARLSGKIYEYSMKP